MPKRVYSFILLAALLSIGRAGVSAIPATGARRVIFAVPRILGFSTADASSTQSLSLTTTLTSASLDLPRVQVQVTNATSGTPSPSPISSPSPSPSGNPDKGSGSGYPVEKSTLLLEVTIIVLGTLIVPAIGVAYLAFRLPARRDQLTSLFKTDGILPKYLAAREQLPEKNPGETAEQYHARLTLVFDRIFSVELRQEYGIGIYALPMALSWITTSFVVCYLIAEVVGHPFLPDAPVAVSFGIFGAFVWTIWNLVGRYSVTNLSPSFLWWIPFRYVVAIAYGVFARLVFNDIFANIGAFVLSLVPISEAFAFLRSRLSAFGFTSSHEPDSGFSNIEGLDSATIDILADLGVVNTQQLANGDPLRLLMRSNFTPNVLIDWMDQCFLFNYVGEKIALLRSGGIRGGIELASIYDYQDEQKKTILISALAGRLGTASVEADALITNCRLDLQLQLLWELWGST